MLLSHRFLVELLASSSHLLGVTPSLIAIACNSTGHVKSDPPGVDVLTLYLMIQDVTGTCTYAALHLRIFMNWAIILFR